METSTNGSNNRVTADPAESQEEDISSSPHYCRFLLWVGLAIGAMLVLGATLDLFVSNFRNKSAISLPVATGLCVSSITIIAALLFATLLFRALTKTLGEQTAWFLDLDKPLGPTSELVVICICLIMNVISLALCHLGDNEATDGWGVVKNANLYYGSWTAVFATVGLLSVFLREYRDVDLLTVIRSGGPRCTQWSVLCLSSLVMMGSALNTFVRSHCRSGDPILPDTLSTHYPSLDADVYCRRTALALGLATTIAFVCIMILCELMYVDDYEKEALLESETMFSFASCLSLVISMGFITSMSGPASAIGNMYYSGWVSFIVSCLLVISCLNELAQRKRRRLTSKRRPGQDAY